jgi:adenine-specific DNA-methyltransferase
MPEEELKINFPNTYKYLTAIKLELNKRDKGKSNPVAWYAYGRTQGLDSNFGKKLLTSNMNQKPNFIYCDEEDSTFIAGYAVKSKRIDMKILQKILNSEIMREYISLISKTYQGGWKSYAKSFIKNFGIPNLSNEQMKFLNIETNREKINKFLELIYFNKNINSTF